MKMQKPFPKCKSLISKIWKNYILLISATIELKSVKLFADVDRLINTKKCRKFTRKFNKQQKTLINYLWRIWKWKITQKISFNRCLPKWNSLSYPNPLIKQLWVLCNLNYWKKQQKDGNWNSNKITAIKLLKMNKLSKDKKSQDKPWENKLNDSPQWFFIRKYSVQFWLEITNLCFIMKKTIFSNILWKNINKNNRLKISE